MSILERIELEATAALRARASARLSTLRLVKSDLKKTQIDRNRDLTEEEAAEVLTKMAKQRRDSIEQFERGNRPDLAEIEKAELEVIAEFLPEAISDEELEAIVERVLGEIGEVDPKKIGAAIGRVMAAVKTTGLSFDGKAVSERVRRRLAP